MTVLVLGAGGFLGLNTVDALTSAGLEVRCGRRRRSNVLALRQRRLSLVEADLEKPATLVEAMKGTDAVIHLAGHYPRYSTHALESTQLALRQTEHVLASAAKAGVPRLIYISSTATVAARPSGASTEADVYTSVPGLGTYHDLKWRMEQLVLAEDRLETVTLCPGACLGSHDWKMGTSAVLWQLRRGKVGRYPDGLVSWVDARDVGEAIARTCQQRLVQPRLLLAAQSMRFFDFLELAADRYQAQRPEAPLSPQAAIALADQEELAAEQLSGRPSLSRELVDLIVHGPSIDASLASASLDFKYRTLDQALDAFDAWAERMTVAPPIKEFIQ